MKNTRTQFGIIIFAVGDRVKIKNYDRKTKIITGIDGQTGIVKWAKYQNNLQVELDAGSVIDCSCWQLDHILTY